MSTLTRTLSSVSRDLWIIKPLLYCSTNVYFGLLKFGVSILTSTHVTLECSSKYIDHWLLHIHQILFEHLSNWIYACVYSNIISAENLRRKYM